MNDPIKFHVIDRQRLIELIESGALETLPSAEIVRQCRVPQLEPMELDEFLKFTAAHERLKRARGFQ